MDNSTFQLTLLHSSTAMSLTQTTVRPEVLQMLRRNEGNILNNEPAEVVDMALQELQRAGAELIECQTGRTVSQDECPRGHSKYWLLKSILIRTVHAVPPSYTPVRTVCAS